MSDQSVPPPQAPKKKGLTPVQIGGGAGAAATILALLVVRDWSGSTGSQGASEGLLSNSLFLGVCAGIGGILGMAIVALVGLVWSKKGGK
jgi:hypothetical protein